LLMLIRVSAVGELDGIMEWIPKDGVTMSICMLESSRSKMTVWTMADMVRHRDDS